MSVVESYINWFKRRKGRVSYSMTNRKGPYSYDCSSAVYFALQEAGIFPTGLIGNTDTLFYHLHQYGFIELKPKLDGSYDTREGDIVIWGTKNQSGGANGHTGIFTNVDDFIHCNYGYNTITENNHDLIWYSNGCPPVSVFRYADNSPNNTYNSSVSTIGKFAQEKTSRAPHWVVERGDTLIKIANYYGIPSKVKDIARYNNIVNQNSLFIGQIIYIPKPLIWVVEQSEIDNGLSWDYLNDYYSYPKGTLELLNPGISLKAGNVINIWN